MIPLRQIVDNLYIWGFRGGFRSLNIVETLPNKLGLALLIELLLARHLLVAVAGCEWPQVHFSMLEEFFPPCQGVN